MFQPPGPGSASPAGGKGPTTVQPQTNPYTQGLYGGQHASSPYDDTGYSHQHHSQHQHQHSQCLGGLPSSDYNKQLYGQGLPGFMGMGQNTGPSPGPTIGQRGNATSPENSYKPYAPNVGVNKDVSSGVGAGAGQGGASQLPQGRSGVQPPQHNQGGFYGANRFSSNPSTGPQSQTQQQHQQQGQGYPQGGNDGSFYYAARNNQQYWQ